MKNRILIALIVVILAACAPAQGTPAINVEDAQNTTIAIAQTGIALTQTALPANTPLPTGTATFITSTETPGLQSFVPIFTPDAIQVEKWQEYQTELAKVLLRGYGPDAYKDALCEWDILGRAGQEVYVWAYCATSADGSGSSPTVIYLEADGSVQKVSTNNNLIRKFPTDVLEKIRLYYTPVYPYEGRPEVLRLHILHRRDLPEEPPLVVLSAMPAATPTP